MDTVPAASSESAAVRHGGVECVHSMISPAAGGSTPTLALTAFDAAHRIRPRALACRRLAEGLGYLCILSGVCPSGRTRLGASTTKLDSAEFGPALTGESRIKPSHVLYLTHSSPVPATLGPGRRHHHILDQLTRFFDVSVLSLGAADQAAEFDRCWSHRLRNWEFVTPSRCARASKAVAKIRLTLAGRCDFLPATEKAFRAGLEALTSPGSMRSCCRPSSCGRCLCQEICQLSPTLTMSSSMSADGCLKNRKVGCGEHTSDASGDSRTPRKSAVPVVSICC